MKEKIEKKLIELKKMKEQSVAQVNALNGAIQVLEELLKEDDAPHQAEKEG